MQDQWSRCWGGGVCYQCCVTVLRHVVIELKGMFFFILTKRDELSFFTVFAFPNDSRIGLACKSCRSNSPYQKKSLLFVKVKCQQTKLIITVKRLTKTCKDVISPPHGGNGTNKAAEKMATSVAVTLLVDKRSNSGQKKNICSQLLSMSG